MSSLLDTDKVSYMSYMGLYWARVHFLIAGGGQGGYPPIKSPSYIILYVNITIDTYNYPKNHFTPPLFNWVPYWGTIFHIKKIF